MAEAPEPSRGAGPFFRLVAGAACGVLAILLASAYWSLPDTGSRLAPLVDANLPGTGVSSRVTGVLLGFRAYDTLLEVTVLLVAASAVRAISSGSRDGPVHVRGPAVLALLRLIAPLGVLLAAYIVWRGGRGAGGAFQAAAALAGAVIALSLGGITWLRSVRPAPLRALLVLGPAAFLGIAVAGLLGGGTFLGIPTRLGATAITTIEVTLTVSIGLALVLLVGEMLPGGPSGPASDTAGDPPANPAEARASAQDPA